MFYPELNYREYFHKIIVFEVDNLTDDVKDKVKIEADDCFIMCTNYVDKNGALMFAVLSVGDSFDNCDKGLLADDELMVYSGLDLAFFNCKVVQGSLKAIAKSFKIIKKLEHTNEELEEIRNETALDFIRNPFYPDKLTIKNFNHNLDIKITKIGDWIIEGIANDKGIVKAIPYVVSGQRRLLTIVTNEDISDEELKMLDQFLIELSKGIQSMIPKDNSKS